MLTWKPLCRSRAEDLRAQLLEFQAPREESRQQMVDWLKSAAGEAKQVSMWFPTAALCAPEGLPYSASCVAAGCLGDLSMCQQGWLEMGLGLPEAVPWNFFPSTDAFCMAPVCQNMVKRPYLRQRG